MITKEVYVGMTANIETRWYAHKKLSATSNPLLKLSIIKYGIENFSFEVLESEIKNRDDAKKKENYYMDILNSLQPKGFNIMMNGGRKMFYSKKEKINSALGTDFQ